MLCGLTVNPVFSENPRQGTLTIGDDRVLSVAVQDLPTIVESFKTYDDTNLVKTNDIGQVRCG